MDLLILIGVFIVGLGIGVTISGKPQPDTRPCSCQCHCAAPSVASAPPPVVPREFSLLLSVIVVVCGIAWFIYLFGLTTEKKGPELVTGSPVKGKGRRGVFGSQIPLQIRDGSSHGW